MHCGMPSSARFARREIPRATVEPVKLVRQGVLVDTRPYFLIRRGLTTAGLYIARFGQDLFVSQVTYFKGPISSMRILILAAAFLFAFIYPVVYSNAFSQIGVSLYRRDRRRQSEQSDFSDLLPGADLPSELAGPGHPGALQRLQMAHREGHSGRAARAAQRVRHR